ncbi:metallophosphoesterase [uncultured Megasphaera sp.]|uniref:metallophosphoesterase n=1 Tax=uncultured Megasphaera sp. TaxID=165188 RepID=UPI00265B471A|nr:metallophosphoesterase [uncultured Megasphaera sp.]
MRYLVLLLIASVVTALSLFLWDYIWKTGRRISFLAAAMAVSVVAVCELIYYGLAFPQWQGHLLFPLLYDSTLASLSWLTMFFLCLPVLLLWAAGCALWRLVHGRVKPEPAEALPDSSNMTRRTFLKGAAAALPLAALATSGYGNIDGDTRLDTVRHDLYFPNLPDYLEGYRIGQISDAHMGMFFGPEDLQKALDQLAVQQVNRLEITGDLIDELAYLPECQKILTQNAGRFPDGIDFCYGNHEYYRGLEEITQMLLQTPVRILRNSHICASTGRGQGLSGVSGTDAAPFYIVGADYSFANGDEAFAAERNSFVDEALQGVPQEAFVIMLAHHSAFLDEGFSRHIPLTLSGHTHGGQIILLEPLVEAVGFKYLRGLFQQDGCWGYVSRGTGHWLPFRLGCSREVSVFTLHNQ